MHSSSSVFEFFKKTKVTSRTLEDSSDVKENLSNVIKRRRSRAQFKLDGLKQTRIENFFTKIPKEEYQSDCKKLNSLTKSETKASVELNESVSNKVIIKGYARQFFNKNWSNNESASNKIIIKGYARQFFNTNWSNNAEVAKTPKKRRNSKPRKKSAKSKKSSIDDFESLMEDILASESSSTSNIGTESKKALGNNCLKKLPVKDEVLTQDGIENPSNKSTIFQENTTKSSIPDSSTNLNTAVMLRKLGPGESFKSKPVQDINENINNINFRLKNEVQHFNNTDDSQLESRQTQIKKIKPTSTLGDNLMDVEPFKTKNSTEFVLNHNSPASAHKYGAISSQGSVPQDFKTPTLNNISNKPVHCGCSSDISEESSRIRPFNINVPANFKADCKSLRNKLVLSDINKIIKSKGCIHAKEVNELLSLLNTFVELNKDGE